MSVYFFQKFRFYEFDISILINKDYRNKYVKTTNNSIFFLCSLSPFNNRTKIALFMFYHNTIKLSISNLINGTIRLSHKDN